MAAAPAPAPAAPPAEGGGAGGDVGELVTNVLGALDVLTQVVASSSAPDDVKQQFQAAVQGLGAAVDGLFGGGAEPAAEAVPEEVAGAKNARPMGPGMRQ